MSDAGGGTGKGFVAWVAEHGVAANMLMAVILIGGVLVLPTVDQEVFPAVDSGIITVSVEMRGAAPDEVEKGVCIKVEEAVAGIEGVKRLTSRAITGMGTVTLELENDAETRDVLDDVKSAVDAIDSFPENSENPVVSEFELAKQVINVALSGDVAESSLRQLGEQVRDDLLGLPGISQAKLSNVRPYEVSIEISEEALRRWGLSFDEVVAAVRRSSLDVSGGSVKTAGGEILLRARHQAYRQRDFEQLVLRTLPDGSRLSLADVATVVDAFEDTGQSTRFDGQTGVLVRVYRVGNQRALEIADAVYEYVDNARAGLPEGVTLTTWQDDARLLRGRMDLLLDNGRTGLLLVFLTLALFLRLGLAFWVTLGIPISFLGAVLLMPVVDVSINMISLFGFIVALGIVVDDAIVVGENVYAHAEKGKRGLAAVLAGVAEVQTPVTFAVLTTIAAFTPLLGIPGIMGEFVSQLPLIVVPVLVFSLVESLLILPAHLKHIGARRPRGFSLVKVWEKVQDAVTALLNLFVRRIYTPFLGVCLRWRYLSLAVAAASLMLTLGAFGAGFIKFHFFPDVEADNVVVFVTMPQGTPAEVTADAVRRIETAALSLRDEVEEQEGGPVFRHVLASVGDQPFRNDQSKGFGKAANFHGEHLGEVNIELVPSEERDIGSLALVSRLRDRTGQIPDTVELVFTSNLMSTGDAIDIQLTGQDVRELRLVADELKQRLREYPGVLDIADSYRSGQQEHRLEVTPEAESLGLTRADLAHQVRQGFYGEEAQRIQRGRDEVRVMVRYPQSERRSLGDVENMRVRLPDGEEVPFSVVAHVEPGRGDAVIQRSERRRSLDVTADVDLAANDPNIILADVQTHVLPQLLADHPGIAYTLEGEQREQADTVGGMIRGFLLALVMIYALLAIPFRSYLQPLIVMLAIPFGIVGAIWGHLLMGMDLTIMSMFGVVALTGVLVNDSLVMVDFINARRREGASALDAVTSAGPARFRAILLTSLTTFAGLLPLLLERSLQAKFLIPMAVSLGFGVLFATAITLVIVPVGYMTLHDGILLGGKIAGRQPQQPTATGSGTASGTGTGTGTGA